ncbi:MAG TPA: ATP-grasp domain-containing protein [Alphaproteobacteria bacterium]|nr:ATP-grasp domain-containing protein [Alphaproteobacteria bacterium]
MKVAILSNIFKNNSNFKEVEDDLTEIGAAVKKALELAGHEAIFFDVNETTFEQLRNSDVEFAFNVCERFNGSSLFEPHIASMLELLNIPYTGSGPLTLATCINKVRVKEILMHHGILTPNYQVFYSRNKKLDTELKFPLIVKPVCMDNSIGITNDAVVRNEEELRSRISYILRTYDQPALVEEYIDGREITVGVLGNGRTGTVLPLSEIKFNNVSAEDDTKIYSYEAKWLKETESWKGIQIECPADLPKYQEYRIKRIALQVYQILGCRDYGRIDFRVSKEGVPYVLELNPNPGISPSLNMDDQPDFIPYSANKAGMTYDELIVRIFNEALERNNMTIKVMQLPKTATTAQATPAVEAEKTVKVEPKITLTSAISTASEEKAKAKTDITK